MSRQEKFRITGIILSIIEIFMIEVYLSYSLPGVSQLPTHLLIRFPLWGVIIFINVFIFPKCFKIKYLNLVLPILLIFALWFSTIFILPIISKKSYEYAEKNTSKEKVFSFLTDTSTLGDTIWDSIFVPPLKLDYLKDTKDFDYLMGDYKKAEAILLTYCIYSKEDYTRQDKKLKEFKTPLEIPSTDDYGDEGSGDTFMKWEQEDKYTSTTAYATILVKVPKEQLIDKLENVDDYYRLIIPRDKIKTEEDREKLERIVSFSNIEKTDSEEINNILKDPDNYEEKPIKLKIEVDRGAISYIPTDFEQAKILNQILNQFPPIY